MQSVCMKVVKSQKPLCWMPAPIAIGISTVRYLLGRGHDVTALDRQPDAALKTSFANAVQIPISYQAPWANCDAARRSKR